MEAAPRAFVVVVQTLVLPGMLGVIINIVIVIVVIVLPGVLVVIINIVIIVLPGVFVVNINIVIVIIAIVTIVIINDFKSCLSSFVESRDTAVPRASGRQRNSRIRDLVIIIIHSVVSVHKG